MSYASVADRFEVGFNYFLRPTAPGGEVGTGNLVYFQPYSSPDVYAGAYLEGSLSEGNLQRYLPRRRRVASKGLIVLPVSSWGQCALVLGRLRIPL
ncbi:hypothetical protein [Paraburkholderia sp. BL25I1N1]|uniref:hypothetical protein n=1 Tax=Paraburkholderia sp. BL25I1N1 TaxID=1938804 RepID=UPI0035BE4913